MNDYEFDNWVRRAFWFFAVVVVVSLIFSLFSGSARAAPTIVGIDSNPNTSLITFSEKVTGEGWWKIVTSDASFVSGGTRSISNVYSDTVNYYLEYGNYTFRYYLVAAQNNTTTTLDETKKISKPSPVPSVPTSLTGTTGIDITIASPISGQIITKNMVITGTALSAVALKEVRVGFSAQVEPPCEKVASWVKASGKEGWSYSWNVEELKLAPGLYYVYAKVIDNNGNYACNSISVYLKEFQSAESAATQVAVKLKKITCNEEICSKIAPGDDVKFFFDERTASRLYLDDTNVVAEQKNDDVLGYKFDSGGEYSLRTTDKYIPIKNFTIIAAKGSSAKVGVDIRNATCLPDRRQSYGEPYWTGELISCRFPEPVYYTIDTQLAEVANSKNLRPMTNSTVAFVPNVPAQYIVRVSKDGKVYEPFKEFRVETRGNFVYDLFWWIILPILIIRTGYWIVKTPIVTYDYEERSRRGMREIGKLRGIKKVDAVPTAEGGKSVTYFQKEGRIINLTPRTRYWTWSEGVEPTSTPAGIIGVFFTRQSWSIHGTMILTSEPYFNPFEGKRWEHVYIAKDEEDTKLLHDQVLSILSRDVGLAVESRIKESAFLDAKRHGTPVAGTAKVDFSAGTDEDLMKEVVRRQRLKEDGTA